MRKAFFARLMPASRHQNHTTSPSASRAVRQRRQSVHRIPRSTFVTIGQTPLFEEHGMARIMRVIWVCDQHRADATFWHDGQITCSVGKTVKCQANACRANAVIARSNATKQSRILKERTGSRRRFTPRDDEDGYSYVSKLNTDAMTRVAASLIRDHDDGSKATSPDICRRTP